MNFSELLEEVMENVSLSAGGSHIQRGEVKRLLNLAQREISLRVGIPQVSAFVPTTGVITGPFALPMRFHPEGQMRVEIFEGELSNGHEVMGREIPVLSPAQIMESRLYDRWDQDDYCGPAFIRHSVADPDAGFTPVGIESARYRFTVQAVPEDMVENSDEPFSVLDWCEDPPIRRPGAAPGFHRILAHHVTYELLQRIGDERWQGFFARFREMQLEMYASVSPITVYLPGRHLRGEYAQP